MIASPLPQPVIDKLRDATAQVLADATAKDPVVKKVHESFFAFKANHDKWAGVSEAVYQNQIRGALKG